MNSTRCYHKVALINEQIFILSGYNYELSVKEDKKCEVFGLEKLTFKAIQNCLLNIDSYGADKFDEKNVFTVGGSNNG